MRSYKKHGWILVETMLALACVAVVLSSYQRQQSAVDVRLSELRASDYQQAREKMKHQMGLMFASPVSIGERSGTPPSCRSCRAKALQTLLDYELNQW